MSEAYQHTEYELRNDIDNISCISYTFERYVEEVNHYIDRLLEDTKEINVLISDIKEKDKEIERLNNIINEIESYLEKTIIDGGTRGSMTFWYKQIYDYLQELKGSDKE